MRSRFAWYIVFIGIIFFYSFLLYTLSAFPFLGVHFDQYFICLVSCVVILFVIFSFLLVYYWAYDHLQFLQLFYVKWSAGFALSFLTLYTWDFFIESVSVHSVVKILVALLFMLAFSEDPMSRRDWNRKAKKQKK